MLAFTILTDGMHNDSSLTTDTHNDSSLTADNSQLPHTITFSKVSFSIHQSSAPLPGHTDSGDRDTALAASCLIKVSHQLCFSLITITVTYICNALNML